MRKAVTSLPAMRMGRIAAKGKFSFVSASGFSTTFEVKGVGTANLLAQSAH